MSQVALAHMRIESPEVTGDYCLGFALVAQHKLMQGDEWFLHLSHYEPTQPENRMCKACREAR